MNDIGAPSYLVEDGANYSTTPEPHDSKVISSHSVKIYRDETVDRIS